MKRQNLLPGKNKKIMMALDCSPELKIACGSDGVTGLLERYLKIFYLFLALVPAAFGSGEPFILRFYGQVNPMGSCRARSVYLTTLLLGLVL